MRNTFKITMLLALFSLLSAGALQAATIYHVGVAGSPPNYPNLNALRSAVTLVNGDKVIIYQDDTSLTAPLNISGFGIVTIEAAEGVINVEGINFSHRNFNVTGGASSLVLKNVNMINNTRFNYNSAIYVNNSSATVTNGAIEGHSNAVEVIGSATVNVQLDESSPEKVTWKNNSDSFDFSVDRGNFSRVNFDVAAGKTLDIQDGMWTKMVADPDATEADPTYADGRGNINIVKTGAGTWKQGGTSIFNNNDTNITISEGTWWLTEKARVLVNNQYDVDSNPTANKDAKLDIYIADGATFRPSITVGDLERRPIGAGEFDADLTRIRATSFIADFGARLEVGNISSFPIMGDRVNEGATGTFRDKVTYPIIEITDPTEDNVKFSSTFVLDNDLVHAFFQQREAGVYELVIDHLANIGDVVTGMNHAADIYRRLDTLSEYERLMMDSIYWTGGYVDPDARRLLQTMGGSGLMVSDSAMRSNWTNLLKQTGKRLTDFQMAYFSLADAGNSISSDSALASSDFNHYDMLDSGGQFWAAASKRWISQREVDLISGYNYNPYGGTIGYDYRLDYWIFGAAAAYEQGTARSRSGQSVETRIRTGTGNIYGSWAREGYYANAGLQFGYGWNRATSVFDHVYYGTTNASYNSSMFGGNMEFGYMYDTGSPEEPLRITPYAGLNYAHIVRDSFTESGISSMNRIFDRGRWNAFDVLAGVRLSKMLVLSDSVILLPGLDLAYVHTGGSRGASTNARFANAINAGSWRVESIRASRDALRSSLSLTTRIRDRFDIGVNYDLEWREKYLENQLNLGLAMGF